MKSVNFIYTIPPKTRYALHRWIVTSALLTLGTCLVLLMLYMRMHQQYQVLFSSYQKLKQTKEQMLTFLQDKRALKEEKSSLQEQATKISRAQEKQKKISSVIEFLAQQNKTSIVLYNLELKKKQAIMTLQAAAHDDIFTYIAHLEQNKLFAQVTLQELIKQDNGVQAIVHATVA